MSTAAQQPTDRRRRPHTWYGRPRFLLILTVASCLAAAVEAWRWLRFGAVYTQEWFGYPVEGRAAAVLATVLIVGYLVTAAGLWAAKPWARRVGVLYLGYTLASLMLWWTPGRYGLSGAGVAILVQVSAVPFVTFSLMYLYQGDRYFRS